MPHDSERLQLGRFVPQVKNRLKFFGRTEGYERIYSYELRRSLFPLHRKTRYGRAEINCGWLETPRGSRIERHRPLSGDGSFDGNAVSQFFYLYVESETAKLSR